MSSDRIHTVIGERRIPVCLHPEGVEWSVEEITEILGSRRPRIVVISDETVALLYAGRLMTALAEHGFQSQLITIVPGEEHKNLQAASRVLDMLIESRLSRDDLILGLGGGVTTDIAGFVAAVYLRGIDWVAVPTSLLAIVDAAIGGKTGVDHPLAKNAIGAFHQPLAVLAPAAVLDTLPEREWLSGSAEVLKAALLTGGELWELFRKHGVHLARWDKAAQLRAIALACSTKAEVVSRDEKESGPRRLLNLGHTFGHAIESASGYRVYRHGEAILLGLRAMIRLSSGAGFLNPEVVQIIDNLLSTAPMPRAELEPAALLDAISRDKKVKDQKINWVLLREVGDPLITNDVDADLVREVAQWICDEARSGSSATWVIPRPRILVLNGPNLNLLGTREPSIYGSASYDDLEITVNDACTSNDCESLIRQSNHEGELVSIIQQARHWANAIIINPGAYTHTSVAIRDALAAVSLPTVEVHLSDPDSREPFRHGSLIRDLCIATINGKGVDGYREAVIHISNHIKTQCRTRQDR